MRCQKQDIRYYIRSYPTYEEWKHDVVQGIDTRRYSSYPTYEEWKLTYRAKVYH